MRYGGEGRLRRSARSLLLRPSAPMTRSAVSVVPLARVIEGAERSA